MTNNLEVWQDGSARPCCLYRGTTGHISEHNKIIQIQTKLAETLSEEHSNCSTCWDHERLGIPSKRQMANDWIKHYDEGAIDQIPNILEIKLSNLCNLACTTCGAVSSSIWANKLKIKPDNQFTKDGAAQRLNNLLELIEKRGVNEIQLIGGEPTINPEAFALLDRIIELGWDKSIGLRLITNGIDIEKFMTRYYDKFLEFHINVSIDGKEDVFEYLRWGGQWTDVLKSLKLLGELQKKRHNKINVGITYTYSVLNLYHYSDFKKWYNEELPQLCRTHGLHVNRADYPTALAPKVINDARRLGLDPDIRTGVEVLRLKDSINQRNSMYAELVIARDLPRGIRYTDYKLDAKDLENIEQIMEAERRHYGSKFTELIS